MSEATPTEQKLAAASAMLAALEWIAGQSDLFFAECSQAEGIVTRARAASAAAKSAGIEVGEMGSQTTLDNRSDTQIEVVARALCRRENPHYTPVQIDHAWRAYKEHAVDAIAALHGSPS